MRAKVTIGDKVHLMEGEKTNVMVRTLGLLARAKSDRKTGYQSDIREYTEE